MNIKHFVESLLIHLLFLGTIASVFFVTTVVVSQAHILDRAPWIIWLTFTGLALVLSLLIYGWIDGIQTTNQLYRISRMEERRRHANYSRALARARHAVRNHDREVQSWERQAQLMGRRL